MIVPSNAGAWVPTPSASTMPGDAVGQVVGRQREVDAAGLVEGRLRRGEHGGRVLVTAAVGRVVAQAERDRRR